jgi:hypothetical protein
MSVSLMRCWRPFVTHRVTSRRCGASVAFGGEADINGGRGWLDPDSSKRCPKCVSLF